jgi:O-glycosyl hydrolase
MAAAFKIKFHPAMKKFSVCFSALLFACLCCQRAAGQAEVTGWGNLRGIRVGGQLVAFTTEVGIFNPDFSQVTMSQREGPLRTSQFVRNGNAVTVGESLQYGSVGARGGAGARGGGMGGRGGGGGFSYTMTYSNSAPGTVDVNIRLTSAADQTIAGIYYLLDFPYAAFAEGGTILNSVNDDPPTQLKTPGSQGRYLAGSSTGLRLLGKSFPEQEWLAHGGMRWAEQVRVSFGKELPVVVQQARISKNPNVGPDDIEVYFPIALGNTTAGQVIESHFTIKAECAVETGPVTVKIDSSNLLQVMRTNGGGPALVMVSSKTDRPFDGMGGNFRIQSPRDAQVIQYNMDHMRVAFGRVALPWNVWQPEENSPPPMVAAESAAQPSARGAEAAPPGAATPAGRGERGGGAGMNSIVSAMEIAQKLAQKNIPMIISCWAAPSWAVVSNDPRSQRFGGTERGQHLDPAKWDAICKSIGSYLVYLRAHYGAEPLYFSFNESDLGIDIHQSPEEHDQAIKKLGAYFKSIGLKTKMLLGDTSDAVPVSFIQPALNDPEAVPYIGAVSFHSWRGATDEQYQKWADAAVKLGLPLFDAEGGNDAQASGYPNVFKEAWYALDEAAEYIRIMRICHPKAILEWQLTQDYSVLTTGPDGALAPTQRFYNLKQFNLTPTNSLWINAQSSDGLVLPAACLSPAQVCTVHLVNNGASRPVTLTGLPATVAQMSVYVTDAKRGLEKLEPVSVKNGTAQFTLQGQTLTTLINEAR